jgi:hypothetical protein
MSRDRVPAAARSEIEAAGEPDASGGWRAEYRHQHVDPGRGGGP